VNIEEFIENNVIDGCEFGMVIPVSELTELLKTHVVFPQEPTFEMLDILHSRLFDSKDEMGPKDLDRFTRAYKALITNQLRG